MVNRDYMIRKLINNGIQGKFINIIKSMYTNTKAYIRYNGLKSNQFTTDIGIKQGCNVSCLIFAIYLNDLEYTLKNRNCKGITIKDTDEQHIMLQLCSLLYADDTIIMSHDANDLQYSLQIYTEYCNKWNLKINTEKTKIMIFGKNKQKRKFTINGNDIEKVNSFKYLGLVFSKNGKYTNGIKHNIEKAKKASFAILRRSKQLNLSISCQLHISETIIKPILLYGCEIFCHENLTLIDTFYTQILKRILCVNKNTPRYMIFGETGCTPPSIDIKKRALSFWIKRKNSLAEICQNIIHKYDGKNNNYSSYLQFIRSSFDNLGLSYIFEKRTTSDDTMISIKLLKKRIKDIFIQTWLQEINQSPKSLFYKLIKTEFCFETYLDKLTINNRITLTKFRLSNHKLPVETGRWINIKRELRVCPLCNVNAFGDEFHYICECTVLNEERKLYIKQYYYKRPNVHKLMELFNTENKNTLTRLCIFIKIINKKLETINQ